MVYQLGYLVLIFVYFLFTDLFLTQFLFYKCNNNVISATKYNAYYMFDSIKYKPYNPKQLGSEHVQIRDKETAVNV